MMMLRPLLLLLAVTAATTAAATNNDDPQLSYKTVLTGFDDGTVLPERIPGGVGLSDFHAVHDDTTNKVYLAGGCNHPDGNKYDEDIGEFLCGSISNSLYIFDLKTETFDNTNAKILPTPRYRHATVLVKSQQQTSQLWLAGGRDLDDDMISTVDMYDIMADNWMSFELDAKYQVSDLAGFAGNNDDGYAYFAGGYNFTYSAMSTTFAIDAAATISTGKLQVIEHDPMPTARGDVAALTSADSTYALVAGGFTDQNEWCEPLSTTEKFDFATASWSKAGDMQNKRADKALVHLNGRIFALAGERQIPDICNVDKPEPGQETLPLDDVEYYDPDTDSWSVLEDLPKHRFRFGAVGYENAIYSFGGQVKFDKDCTCFPVSDEVIKYTEVFTNQTITDAPMASPTTTPTTNGKDGPADTDEESSASAMTAGGGQGWMVSALATAWMIMVIFGSIDL